MLGECPRKPVILVPALKDGGGSVTIWATISWYSSGLVIALSGQINASDDVDILGNQLRPMIQRLFLTMQFFIMTFRPYTQPEVFSLGLTSMEMHFNIFPGQHNHRTSISSNRCGRF
jgi:hypothetical protein